MDALFALSMNQLLILQHAACHQCLAEILHSNTEMPSFEGRIAMPLLLWFSCHAQSLTCPCVWNEEPWCSLPAPDSWQCRWSHCVPIPVISASLGQQLLVLIIELHKGSPAERQFFSYHVLLVCLHEARSMQASTSHTLFSLPLHRLAAGAYCRVVAAGGNSFTAEQEFKCLFPPSLASDVFLSSPAGFQRMVGSVLVHVCW